MSTALYRRYRPDTFAEVIGQDHVTEPLVAAIDSGRINHAYLFSGPRGCGKTTSARIFARCLNCAEGPTGSPCGVCPSCVDLARGGPGSLDVVELDAASHGGVDDARDLRERAIFAPARDRYKIFIIDEAHMVTTQGFNALLKLVEEPPEHVKFVFATTEPEKVIGTIRSRTHHYPFRLVPPERLSQYLQELSQSEDIRLEDGVIPLVVRAGAGSVRDSLSVLDQLMAGAIDGVVSYQRAVALLGYTPEGLLDDAVAALAAQDGAGLFGVVDQVISSGHDPRRFTEDLLERFRDLIIVLAAGDNARAVLPEIPADQLERMRSQAGHLGAAGCSRAADLVHEALDQMVGATSPRLQLELLCARLLLPSTEEGVRALAVRLDRVESMGPGAEAGPFTAAALRPRPATEEPAAAPVQDSRPEPAGAAPARPEPERTPSPPAAEPERPARPERAQEQAAPRPAAAAWAAAAAAQEQRAPQAPPRPAPETPEQPEVSEQGPESAAGDWPTINVPGQGAPAQEPAPEPPVEQPAPAQEPAQTPAAPESETPTAAEPAQPQAQEQDPGAALTVQQLRNRWPEVLQTLARIKRTTWALVAQDAQVVDLQPDALTVGFSTAGLASAFQRGSHAEFLSQAVQQSLGIQARVEATIVGPAGRGGASPQAVRSAPPAQPAQPRRPAQPEQPAQAPPQAERPPAPPREGSSGAQAPAQQAPPAEQPPAQAPEPVSGSQEPKPPPSPHPPAEESQAPPPWEEQIPPSEPPDDYDDYSPDDAEVGGSDLVGAPLVAKMLGGTVIDEIVEE